MVKPEIQEKVIERFIKLQLEESPTSELFLRNLINRRIILVETMRDYCIRKDFDLFLKANKGIIEYALEDFEEDYKITPRHIRRILYKSRPYC